LIQISTGKKLGYGFAVCSNKESLKRGFDEYAIASMAQTRGIAKAYRNLIGFIMMAAGYADTPAEEILEPSIVNNIQVKPETQISEKVVMEVQRIADIKTLQQYWEDNKELQKNRSFNQLIQARKIALIKPLK
jgi:hypothetical protein